MKPSFEEYIPFKQINLPDRQWPNTVSYTHLDVYKRQSLIILHNSINTTNYRHTACRYQVKISVFIGKYKSIFAVSYTHLMNALGR